MADDTLIAHLAEAAKCVFTGKPILAAYAFGSRIAGRALPSSDLDVGYYLTGYLRGERLPLREELLLEADLCKATGLDVDLRNLALAPLELRGKVLEEGVRIYSSDDVARVGLERDLLGRYHDYKDVYRRMHEIRLRRHANLGR